LQFVEPVELKRQRVPADFVVDGCFRKAIKRLVYLGYGCGLRLGNSARRAARPSGNRRIRLPMSSTDFDRSDGCFAQQRLEFGNGLLDRGVVNTQEDRAVGGYSFTAGLSALSHLRNRRWYGSD
jgi:hypothetical protein